MWGLVKFSRFLTFVTALLVWTVSVERGAYAYSQQKTTYGNIANEFFFSNADGEVLIPLRLLGESSGLYHLPVGSEFSTLLTLSSALPSVHQRGPIYIKRMGQDRQEVIKVNWEENINEVVPEVVLKPHDVVSVHRRQNLLQTDYASRLRFYLLVTEAFAPTFTILNYVADDPRGQQN